MLSKICAGNAGDRASGWSGRESDVGDTTPNPRFADDGVRIGSKEGSLNYRFTKTDRLLTRAQFVHLANHAKKVHSHLFIAFFEPSPHASSRIGITVSRKVGNAATRNRIKRLAREYFRQNRRTLEHPWDIHVIAKREAAASGNQAVLGSLEKIFKRIEASIEPSKAE